MTDIVSYFRKIARTDLMDAFQIKNDKDQKNWLIAQVLLEEERPYVCVNVRFSFPLSEHVKAHTKITENLDILRKEWRMQVKRKLFICAMPVDYHISYQIKDKILLIDEKAELGKKPKILKIMRQKNKSIMEHPSYGKVSEKFLSLIWAELIPINHRAAIKICRGVGVKYDIEEQSFEFEPWHSATSYLPDLYLSPFSEINGDLEEMLKEAFIRSED